MATVNASGKVIGVAEADNGDVTVTIASSKTLDTGQPSFKLTYEFPGSSPAIAAYPLGALVSFVITTTPPVAAAPVEPVGDQFTTTQSLSSSSGPEAPETPVEVPVVDSAAPAVETPVEVPVEPEPVAEPVVEPAPEVPAEPAPEADVVPLAPEEPPAV